MSGSSSSIAELVRQYVYRDAFLLECLQRGIVNYSELARQLVNEIAKEVNIKFSYSAVKMALVRISKRIEKVLSRDLALVLAQSSLALQDDVVIIIVSRDVLVRILKVLSKLIARSRFIQVTQSLRTVTIVVAREDANQLLEQLKDQVEDVVDGQSVVILVSPKEIVRTPGVIAFITGYLAKHGINITQIISCHLDTLIVLDSKDATKAYHVLHELISWLRSKYLSRER